MYKYILKTVTASVLFQKSIIRNRFKTLNYDTDRHLLGAFYQKSKFTLLCMEYQHSQLCTLFSIANAFVGYNRN